MAVADPKVNLQLGGSREAVFAIKAELGDLDATQLRAIMVNLDAASAQRFVAPLNLMMRKYGITTLEQRSMFLAQLGHESKGLTDWIEDSGPKGNEYFLQKYWLQLNWTGLGKSVVNREGILLRVPAEKGVQPSKTFELYFSGSRSYNSAATLIGSAEFTRRNGFYEYQFNGAVPTKLTSHLLVVEVTAKNRFVKLAINNPLGNFRPEDSWDFRGRGPIQLNWTIQLPRVRQLRETIRHHADANPGFRHEFTNVGPRLCWLVLQRPAQSRLSWSGQQSRW